MNIKEIIKNEMKRQNLTGKDLSNLTGIVYSTLMGFINSKDTSINVHKLEHIFDALKLEIVFIN